MNVTYLYYPSVYEIFVTCGIQVTKVVTEVKL